MEKAKNAVIGLAFNYNTEDIAPFLNSLNEVGFDGDLILYVNNTSKINKNNYSYNVECVNFEAKNKIFIIIFKILSKFFKNNMNIFLSKIINKHVASMIDNNQSINNFYLSFFYANYYLATVRFVLYYSFLIDKKYDKVFLTDINDVIFQKNIFEKNIDDKLYSFEENSDIMLSEQYHNSEWIIFGYGMQVYWNMKSRTIVCSGTILGKKAYVLGFLKKYIAELLNNKFPNYMIGLDQGIYNFMLYKYGDNIFNIVSNGDLVYTVGTKAENNIVINNDEIVDIDKMNEVPCVVHQFNRHKFLIDFVNRKYR